MGVLGPTDPKDAPAGSLRGDIMANWQDLGLSSEPNMGDNGMHASASPFEGFAERNNWLGMPVEKDSFAQTMLSRGVAGQFPGVSESLLKAWSVDPAVNLGDKTGSIFDALEDLDVQACRDKLAALAKFALEASGIKVLAEGSLPGEVIDEKKLIDQHYYAIASKATILTPDQLKVPSDKFKGQFGIEWSDALASGKAFNALDGCKHLGIDAATMATVWNQAKDAKKLVKLGGGFYCGLIEIEGKEPVYIFNGFFMEMRSKFTAPGSSIYYFSVEWDPKKLSWADFRGKVLGPTDPKEAPAGSLRGDILAKWQELGLSSEPNMGDNGMHASASPFEGLCERNNWLEVPIHRDSFGGILLSEGVSDSLIKNWSVDPQVTIEPGKTGSIFDQLEDIDVKACSDKVVALSKLA